mmetsp:Transcript_6902/g.7001  ORF Transcript_6902/g.7001 Transcript_6902/m.7001 type:complete len:233 (+) Transcript_6902:211-909(+)
MTTAKTVLRDSLIREFGCLDDPNLPNTSEYTQHSSVGVADGLIVGAVIGHEAGGVISSFHDTNDLNSRNKKFQKAVINMRMTLIDGLPSMIHGMEYLFVGSIGSAYNLEGLTGAGITHILCLSNNIRQKYPENFIYNCIDIKDRVDHNIGQHFEACFEYILRAKREGGKCLIHCYQGKSRSVAIISAYLIKYYNHTLESSLGLIRINRSISSPNNGFLRSLYQLETKKSNDI